MRFLLKATMPLEAGNALVRDPSFGKVMEEILADLKPDAVYYAIEHGQRTIYFVVDLAQTHDIPAVAEPLWLALKANVEAIPAMNQEEFAKAAAAIENAVKKY